MEPRHPHPPAHAFSVLTRAVVRVVADHTGRGPTKVTVTVGPDVACVVMRDNHTRGERALMASGEHALVAELRRAYHRAMQPALLRAAREATGREIHAVLADHDPRHDVSTLNFVLAPIAAPADGPSRPRVDRSSSRLTNGSSLPALTLS